MTKTALRIRFVFNQQVGDTFTPARRQRLGSQFAQSIVEDFAFRYADESYRNMARQIETQLQRDVRRELVHMAALFRYHIIGAAPRSSKPAGFLTTMDPGDFNERVSISASIPAWASRSQQYLRDKKRKIGHTRWWDHRGGLSKAMTADSWISAFGPIMVRFSRNRNAQLTGAGRRPNYLNQFGGALPGHVKVAIGTVRVLALTNITPAMLPALRTGDPTTMNSSAGNEGLMGLVRSGMGSDIAHRLGRRSSTESGRLYRPTLEPFLAFYLTRAVPNAIANRIEKGTLGRGRGSGGRTR